MAVSVFRDNLSAFGFRFWFNANQINELRLNLRMQLFAIASLINDELT